jgi:hypothetical protein
MNSIPLATLGQPLFGSLWVTGLIVCAAIAALLFAVAFVGRWLAATHPDPVLTPPAAVPAPETGVSPETMAIIACAVRVALGSGAQVTAVALTPQHTPSVEALMLQWSLEGRRQIYTSHKVR